MSMFPVAKNIETSFRHLRMVTITAVIGSFLSGIFFFVWAERMVMKAESKIYILSAGKALEAFASDRKPNLDIEARAHVADFHEYFFTLDPDEKFIADRLKRALYLADVTARRVYENLKESGYYGNVVSANISQRIEVDSVSVTMNRYPFYFRCYATETITRATSIVTRSLVTEGRLRAVNRSENNPHGFLIERWTIIENRDLKIEQRLGG